VTLALFDRDRTRLL